MHEVAGSIPTYILLISNLVLEVGLTVSVDLSNFELVLAVGSEVGKFQIQIT